VISSKVLLDGWSRVIRVAYLQNYADGSQQLHDRDLLDRGDGVSVLLYNQERGTVLLVRQPRIVATLLGHSNGETLEVCNGLVQNEEPLACALREVQEELGHSLEHLRFISSVYASPGGSTELIHFFLGEYSWETRLGSGGGLADEGEDIEVIEVTYGQAIHWARDGTIRDARSILALYFAAPFLALETKNID
jgi:GDP-mannose pyrophosphatase NudK